MFDRLLDALQLLWGWMGAGVQGFSVLFSFRQRGGKVIGEVFAGTVEEVVDVFSAIGLTLAIIVVGVPLAFLIGDALLLWWFRGRSRTS